MKPQQTRRPMPGSARSAVKRPATARPAAKTTKPASARNGMRLNAATDFLRSRRFNIYTLTAIGLAIFAAILVGPMVQVWINQQRDIAAVQAQLDQAQKDLAKMRVERTRWDDPVYIRAQARERLYYVLPGEVSYLVMDAGSVNTSDNSGTVGASLADARNTTQISNKVTATSDNWVDLIAGSVIQAGTTQPAPKKK